MNTKLLAVILCVLTGVTVVFYPGSFSNAKNIAPPAMPTLSPEQIQTPIATTNTSPAIDVVFVLDTTGSMGGLIDAAKEKIWSIASTMASAEPAPSIRIGIVAYRDRGDDYVTRAVPLTYDLDSAYASLMDFKAEGGGDTPESVNKALFEAVNTMNWNTDTTSYKAIFLVGDAAPHADYDEVQYPDILAQAKQKGIVVNAVQCGSDGSTTTAWQQIAQLGYGEYVQVAQDGSAVAVATPFDEKIASLSRELDGTRLFYGNKEEQKKFRSKLDAAEKLHADASAAAQARRGVFNSSNSGKRNFAGEADLIADISAGKTRLADIEKEALPASIRTLPATQQSAAVEEIRVRRENVTEEIRELADKRQAYIEKELAKSDSKSDGLDNKLYEAIRIQAKEKGLSYAAEAPKY